MGHIVRPTLFPPTINGPVHVECRILKYVVSSATKAENAGTYANCCTSLDLHNMLHASGHPQVPIEIKTDNITTVAFSNTELKTKRSKS